MNSEFLQEISNIFKTEIGNLKNEINQKLVEQEERIMQKMDQKLEEQEERIMQKMDQKLEEQEERIMQKMNQKLEEQEERIMQKMNQNFEEQEKRISENIFGKLMKEVHQMLLDQMFAFEEQYGRALTLAVEELKYRNSIERAQDQRIESLEERYQTNSAFIYSHEKRISNLENNSKKII